MGRSKCKVQRSKLLFSLALILLLYSHLIPPVLALELKDDPVCGQYYQSENDGEEACAIPTTLQGTLDDTTLYYPSITFSAADIPTEGDLEYLLGKWPKGILPHNLTPEECKKSFLSQKDPLVKGHTGVLPLFLSPDDVESLCEAPDYPSDSQTLLEDWYRKKSYGEIIVHPGYATEDTGTLCVLPKTVEATFPVWGPMNTANDLWSHLKSPAIDDSRVFLESAVLAQDEFICPREQNTNVSFISNPPLQGAAGPYKILAGERCAEGECETLEGPEESVCFFGDNTVEFDPLENASTESDNRLTVDMSFRVQHLSGENVTDTSFSSYQAGEEIEYGYTTAMVGAPDKYAWGEVAKTHNDMGVYNIFLSPVDDGSTTAGLGMLAGENEKDVPGRADLAVSIPLSGDNDDSKYKALGSVEAMQRYVCLSLLSPDQNPSACDVEVTPQPPEEEGDFIVEKIANPTRIENEELPKDINFYIKITAKYKSINVSITNETTVTKNDGTSFEITTDKDGNDITHWPQAGDPQLDLEAGEVWETSYIITATSPEFEDSRVTDIVTVEAETIERPGGCEICGLIGGESGWKSQELIKILSDAGNAFGAPATVIAGILSYEGSHRGGEPWVHQFDDETVRAASEPYGEDPYCITALDGAGRGPFQFTIADPINGWPKYKNAAIEAGVRAADYIPNICNILDTAYAAAKKLRTDVEYGGSVGACNPWRGDPPDPGACDWTEKQVYLASCRYHGACGKPQFCPSDNPNCYCQKTNHYFENYACE